MTGNKSQVQDSPGSDTSDDVARRAAASRVLARSVLGRRLLTGYYVAAAAALITICVVARGVAGWAIVAAVVIGSALLALVRIASAAARKPLRQGWPMLAAVTGWGKPRARGSRANRQSQDYFRPLDGGAGFTYVLALLALAGLAGVLYTVSAAAAATSNTSVDVGACHSTVRGPDVCEAHWRAGGRTYGGTIIWASTSDAGTVIGGRCDPAAPGTVYSASFVCGRDVDLLHRLFSRAGATIRLALCQSRAPAAR